MNDVIRWYAAEHDHKERGREWYIALGVLAVSLALLSVLFANYFFAILILVAATTLALHAREAPPVVLFELSDRGLSIAGALHPWSEILAFWVEEKGEPPLLLVDTTKWLSPNYAIPLLDVDPHSVREMLKGRVEERLMHEQPWHKILEFFGF